ncbi:MAG: RagB/SusD family nutrient uptake outer membrane protein [Sphingobacteriales bacterium]|nr:RagB/SusD family nutrient uptake outer membrane protein [Sphingobacteriales bacterium]
MDTLYFKYPANSSGISVKRPVAKEVSLGGNSEIFHGWSYKKYQTLDSRLDDIRQADGANQYFLRLSDVYLLYAEACTHTGDQSTALEFVNKVHRRAYGATAGITYSDNTPSSYDYTMLEGNGITKADATLDPYLNQHAIAYERYVELFGEGHWWFDICRWKIGQSEATYADRLFQTQDSYLSKWSDGRSYVLPIPITELNSNSKIVQTPGQQ